MEKITTPFKKIYTSSLKKALLSFLIVCMALNVSLAAEKVEPLALGTVKEFKSSFSKITPATKNFHLLRLESNKEVTIKITENISRKNDFFVFGTVEGHEQATFFVRGGVATISGKVIFKKEKTAYDIYTNNEGKVVIAPVDISTVICIDYKKYEAEEGNTFIDDINDGAKKGDETMVAPILNSLPGAVNTIYLDFDGESTSSTSNWGAITAQASNFTNANITTIWTAVAEDYSPFNVNVTTDRTVFNSALTSKKMMVIFTPNDAAAPGAGGVAFLNSWGSGEPCWVFNTSVKSALEAASHETGHTMGLSHDGRKSPVQEYYGGHVRWGPIMGATYGFAIVQWSKGEYTGASQVQNDITIIANKLAYRVDDAGNDPANAKGMVVGAGGTVASASNFGIIERSTDKDVFGFITTGGATTFTITPKTQSGSASIPDLDIQARILDAAGTEIVKVDPPATSTITAPVYINQNLAAGTYYLEIDGVGFADPLSTGYSDYGSIGQYSFSGNIPGGTTIGINEIENTHAINVFPNPSSGVFTINIPLEGNNESTIEIINSLGQPVMISSENSSGNINKQIDLSGHAAGIYCVVIRSGNDVWKGKVILK